MERALTADDFEPFVSPEAKHGISRPSLSYWQDAWVRLKQNRRALVSLYIVVALLIFTVFGPLIWRVDSSAQDLDQVSQPPGTDRSAVLVGPPQPWTQPQPVVEAGMVFAGTPTTQSVRLAWAPLPDARGYRVYRNIYPYEEGEALGLPLADVLTPGVTRFEDRLDISPGTHYYSVVGLDDTGAEITGVVATGEVAAERAISITDAAARGLIDPAEGSHDVGDTILLAAHPLGTDYLGRDMLARLMEGARVSLFIGVFAPLFYVLVGVIYGSIAGFVGGTTDQALMRFADFVVALPFLLFMILFKIAFGIGPGESGILPMLIALVLLSWPATARLVRGQILQIREEGYIDAAQLLGGRTGYLVMRHMIPNTMGVILVTLTFAIPSAIFTEAFLSFIGMGVAPPTPSWGSMCNEGIKTMLTHPHELILPAVFISITVLAFNLLGDGLRDALDARMRSRE